MVDKVDKTELLTMYQIAIDDIRDSKQQQWRVIHLTLLAIAAIAAVANSLKCPIILHIVVSAISALGILFIWVYAGSLQRFRNKKRLYLRLLSIRRVERRLEEKSKTKKFLRHSCFFASVFTFIIVIAWFIAIRIMGAPLFCFGNG